MNAISGEKIARRGTKKHLRRARRDFSERANSPYSIGVFVISFFARAISFFKIDLRFARSDHARDGARRRAEFARARTPFVKWSRGF